MEILTQTVGWVGAALVVLAYILVSAKKVKGNDKSYQAMNLFGALGVSVNTLHQRAWPSFALQVAWIIIAITALLKSLSVKRTN